MTQRISALVPPLLLAVLALGAGGPPAASGGPGEAADASGPELALAAGVAPPSVDVREWKVPWADTRPRDPYVRSRDRVWFVGQRGHYLAYLDPETGKFERYDLEPGTGPHNLIVEEDGTVWYAGNRAAHIGRLDPETGEIEKVPMPREQARDPHTLRFDHRGDIWFTVQGGNFIGKLDVGSREVRLVEVPTPRARPYGIVMNGQGRPWVALLGTNKLATVDPETMEIREVELPRPDARPRRVRRTSDGAIWYVDYARGHLGRYDPETGEFSEWTVPGGTDARPYGMAADGRDRLWFVETGPSPNRLVGFSPATEEFVAITEIPSGGGTVRNMFYFAPDDEIWFGADTNTIGRAAIE